MSTTPFARLRRSTIRRVGQIAAAWLPVVLTVTVAGTGPALAAPTRAVGAPGGAAVPPIAVEPLAAQNPPARVYKPASAKPAPVWPAASSAEVAVGSVGARSGSPVSISAAPSGEGPSVSAASVPGRMRVDVLSQADSAKAGVRGVLVRLARSAGAANAAGPVRVAVSYAGFATAFGGDWSSRLRLVSLPECAVTTPGRPECVGTVLPGSNDTVDRVVSADVTVGSPVRDESARAGGTTLIAVMAGVSGAAGSFAATSLSASSSWSAGNSAGDFSWSYPVRVPPGVGGPEPTVELGYSSQAVDGRMAASNNQPSDVGEGFDLSIGGFVERRYRDCWEDRAGGNNTVKTGDQCWATDNATVNLGGRAIELIRDATDVNRWHPRKADGSRVERRFGAPNGARDGEWWVLTTTSGTQYWFGRNKLPGSPADRATNSVLTVPVFGNHNLEPCNKATFNASWCTQAYRWNLDYVIDPHENSMSLWYSVDTNYYAKNLVTTTPEQYKRGGRLDRVEYGTRGSRNPDAGTDTVFAGMAAARVVFGYADRCLSNCGTHNETTWPDTPWDLECGSGSCLNASASFWTTKRLATVTTQVRNSAANDFRDVERWTLTHGFPDPEDSTRAGLWLEKISHVGLVGGTTSVPDLTFEGEPMHNRVDTVDHSPSMNWQRLVGIRTETGGLVQIDYSDPDCVAGSRVPSAPEHNTLRCYPVKWTPEGHTTAKTDYFHKYVVDEDWYAGMVREQRVFNGPGGPEVSASVNDPWHSDAVATRTIAGATVAARYVETKTVTTRTARDGGRPPVRTRVTKDFDAYGLAVKVDDVGDLAVTGDENCATTTYEPRNLTAWLIGFPHSARSYALSCAAVAGGGTVTADDVTGATRTGFDGQAPGTAPVRGDVTQVEQMSAFANGTPTYAIVARSGYDSHGRVVDSWDALNFHSGTAFTPASGGPVTQTVDINPLNWTTTTTVEPAWGHATSTVDANGLRQDLQYDSLGRLTAGWNPGRTKGTDPAHVRYTYTVRRDGATAVTTDHVAPNGGYTTSHTLYDGLLRPWQTQSASPAGGRLLTDTFYDSAGRVVRSYGTYFNTGTPGVDLVAVVAGDTVPKQSRLIYDGAGRAIASVFQPYEAERWRTTATCGGDYTTVTPAHGGTATTSFVDARGRTTLARVYQGDTPTGDHVDTAYEYNRKGLLSKVTDSVGNEWTFGYDLKGRQTSMDDPDSGGRAASPTTPTAASPRPPTAATASCCSPTTRSTAAAASTRTRSPRPTRSPSGPTTRRYYRTSSPGPRDS